MQDRPPGLVKAQGSWVQTDRAAHEQWAQFLTIKGALNASRVLHLIISRMGAQNAYVVEQSEIAESLGVDARTVRRGVALLREHNWVQVLPIGGPKSGVHAYVVNSRVAWQGPRDGIRRSAFDARVSVVCRDPSEDLDGPPLRHIPQLYPGEAQLPSGPGLPPVSQPALPGMDPDLPALRRDEFAEGVSGEFSARGIGKLREGRE